MGPQYDNAILNCSGLVYSPLCSYPIIFSLHAEQDLIEPSVNNIPTYISRTTLKIIATDISSIEEVLGSAGFAFISNFSTGRGARNKILIFSPPRQFSSCSYTIIRHVGTLSIVKSGYYKYKASATFQVRISSFFVFFRLYGFISTTCYRLTLLLIK